MNDFTIRLGNIQSINRQLSDGLTFLLVLKGQIQITEQNQKILLGEKHMIVQNHGDIYSMEGLSDNLVLIVNPKQRLISRLFEDTARTRFKCCSCFANETTEPLYDSMRHRLVRMGLQFFRGEEAFQMLMHSELIQIYYTMTRYFRLTNISANEKMPTQRISLVCAYMLTNCAQDLSLKSVAHEFYISPEYLSRLFKKEIGMTFSEYLNTIRLENALYDLLNTDFSVTRVALGQGFSSVSAFNNAFSKRFSCTPKEYRLKNKQIQIPDKSTFFFKSDHGYSLEALLKFIEKYDEPSAHKYLWDIDVIHSDLEPNAFPKFCINIGHLHNLLHSDVEEQLLEVVNTMKITYISIEELISQKVTDIFDFYDTLNLLMKLKNLNLIPWIRINTDMEAVNAATLECFKQHFDKDYLSKWRFEFELGNQTDINQFIKSYETLMALLPEAVTGIAIYSEVINDESKSITFNQLYKVCRFISVKSDPNEVLSPEDALSYETFHKSYHMRTIVNAKAWMIRNNLDVPLWLSEWNTLTGRSFIESGEFHRTALIAHTMVSLRNEVEGITLQLNLRLNQKKDQDNNSLLITQPLSFYLYRQIKRPLFFVARAICSLGNNIVHEEEGLLLTQKKRGEYILVFYQPRYFDPFQSLENIQENQYRSTMEVTLSGIPKGKYQIKRFYMDRDNGSTYCGWKNVDLNYLDSDVIAYLESVSNPSVYVDTALVKSHLQIKQMLTLNAVALCSIKCIEEN